MPDIAIYGHMYITWSTYVRVLRPAKVHVPTVPYDGSRDKAIVDKMIMRCSKWVVIYHHKTSQNEAYFFSTSSSIGTDGIFFLPVVSRNRLFSVTFPPPPPVSFKRFRSYYATFVILQLKLSICSNVKYRHLHQQKVSCTCLDVFNSGFIFSSRCSYQK